MANVTFNVAKGRVPYYASLPGTNDALIAVPLEAAGLASDATLIDYADLATLLGGTSNPQTIMGRKTLAAVTATVNNTDNRVEVDAADIVWSAASGPAVGALLICYDPDTTAGDDTSIIPLVKLDFSVTPAGANITAVFPANGFFWAS